MFFRSEGTGIHHKFGDFLHKPICTFTFTFLHEQEWVIWHHSYINNRYQRCGGNVHMPEWNVVDTTSEVVICDYHNKNKGMKYLPGPGPGQGGNWQEVDIWRNILKEFRQAREVKWFYYHHPLFWYIASYQDSCVQMYLKANTSFVM